MLYCAERQRLRRATLKRWNFAKLAIILRMGYAIGPKSS